jgi:hypothetical protein
MTASCPAAAFPARGFFVARKLPAPVFDRLLEGFHQARDLREVVLRRLGDPASCAVTALGRGQTCAKRRCSTLQLFTRARRCIRQSPAFAVKRDKALLREEPEEAVRKSFLLLFCDVRLRPYPRGPAGEVRAMSALSPSGMDEAPSPETMRSITLNRAWSAHKGGGGEPLSF